MKISLTICDSEASAASILVIVPDHSMSESEAKQFTGCLAAEFKTYIVTSGPPPRTEVLEYAAALEKSLLNEGVKRATFLGIAAGGAVVQAMSNVYPKTVRRVILLDSSARVAPGFWQKVSDYLEEFFPLGLPLRSLSAEFDSRPMLHRIHCPALVLVSASAGVWLEDQAKMIARRIPNAWFAKLKGSSLNHEGVLSEELRSKVKEFLQVPAKRPQKALRAVAG